jgi:hypothetical protein
MAALNWKGSTWNSANNVGYQNESDKYRDKQFLSFGLWALEFANIT